MKPDYPKTNHQGFSIISFDINEDASISDVKVEKSMCVDSRDDQGKIKFKSCPFFIPVSIAASKYLKYKNPVNKNGKAKAVVWDAIKTAMEPEKNMSS